MEDIRSVEDANEFCLKMKACLTHNDGDMPIHFFLCPNYSQTEFAVIANCHHCCLDGTSVLQIINLWSDEMEKGDDYYPFVKQKSIPIYYWAFVYLTFPYYAYQCIKLWYSLKNDKNCIKK